MMDRKSERLLQAAWLQQRDADIKADAVAARYPGDLDVGALQAQLCLVRDTISLLAEYEGICLN